MITPTYSWNQGGLPANKFRYRTNWLGQVILQIGVARRLYSAMMEAYTDKYEWVWRDATIQDMTEGEYDERT